MIEATKAQLFIQVIGVMVDVDMNPMPPKFIGREVCLQVKGLYGLSKDLGPKKCVNIWKRE